MDSEIPSLVVAALSKLTQTFLKLQALLKSCAGKGMQGQRDDPLPDLKELRSRRYIIKDRILDTNKCYKRR